MEVGLLCVLMNALLSDSHSEKFEKLYLKYEKEGKEEIQ